MFPGQYLAREPGTRSWRNTLALPKCLSCARTTHVLEIGCGFGALPNMQSATRAAGSQGTLSREQEHFARDRLAAAGLSDNLGQFDNRHP